VLGFLSSVCPLSFLTLLEPLEPVSSRKVLAPSFFFPHGHPPFLTTLLPLEFWVLGFGCFGGGWGWVGGVCVGVPDG